MREDIGDANRPELQRREPREWKRFHNLNDWVSAVLVRIYNSPLDHETLWCSQWWMHDEAVYRLDALWRAWEYSRVNDGPLADATWFVYYADPIMAHLMYHNGCFQGCTPTEHRDMELHPNEELPTTPAPFQVTKGNDTYYFQDLNAWVQEFLALIYNRAARPVRLWCHQWWLHDEAVYRLDALWHAWEHTRVNDGPMGAATWLVNYADPMMTELTKPDGCFNGCDTTQHRAHELNPGEELPTQDAPLPRPAPGEPLPKPQE